MARSRGKPAGTGILRRFPQTERAGSPADLQPKKPAAFVTAETYHIVALDSGSVFFLQRGLQEA